MGPSASAVEASAWQMAMEVEWRDEKGAERAEVAIGARPRTRVMSPLEYASRCRNAKEIPIRVQKRNTEIQFRIPESCIPWVFRGYSVSISIPGKKKQNPAGVDAKNQVTTSCACAASNDAQKTRTQLRARRGWVARCITRTGAGGQGEKQTSTRQTGGRGNKRDDDDEREHRRDVQERANSGRD